MTESRTVDPSEVDRFSRLAAEWWNPHGKFKPLHTFNPVRLTYIRQTLVGHFNRDTQVLRPLHDMRVVDIGCGGGLLSEPLARLGANVTGIDPSETNIAVARLHAEQSGVAVDYRATTAEALLDAGETYDVVLAMEVVEHVADVPEFLTVCARMVRPGGLMLVATINRTAKAFALAIVGAEYVLRWLPRGTHQYEKLVRPEEIAGPVEAAGLTIVESRGVAYDPLRDAWRLVDDLSVNYMTLARRP